MSVSYRIASSIVLMSAFLTGQVEAGSVPASGEWPRWRRDWRLTGHQPMPGAIAKPALAWQFDLAGWEALITVRPSPRDSNLKLAGQEPVDPDYLARSKPQWQLAAPSYDLTGSGQHDTNQPGPEDARNMANSKVGKMLPNTKGLQRAVVVRGLNQYSEETETGWVKLYSYEQGVDKPKLEWKLPSAQRTHRPYVMLADVDGDGDLDICHSDWGLLAAYDGQTGQLLRKVNWLDRRHRGVFVAQDIDHDNLPEFVVIGHFHMSVSVVDNGDYWDEWDQQRFKVLWSINYEDELAQQDRIVRAGRNCLADLDGDGRYELAYNLIDLTTDAVWHVMIHDALSGKVVAELAGHYLDDAVDLDGDGRLELMLSESSGLALPAYRRLSVANLIRGQLKKRWQGEGRLHQRFDGRVPQHTTEEVPFYDLVCGDVNGDGGKEFFVSSRISDDVEVCTALGLEAEDGVLKRWHVQWSRDLDANVLAVNPSNGQVLIRCRVSSGEPILEASGAEIRLASWSRQVDPLIVGTAIVSNFKGRPTIFVPKQWDRIAALQSSDGGDGPTLRWQRRGRPMLYEPYETAHSGILAVDLDEHRPNSKQLVFAAEGLNGAACIKALDASGQPLWQREFPNIQWAPTRGWQPGAMRTWSAGHFRPGRPRDVYVSARLNAQHTGTSYVLDGRDGSFVWQRLYLKGRMKEIGAGHVSIADVDGDGIDEIAGGFCRYYWVLNGLDGQLKAVTHTPNLFRPLMANSWVHSSTPILLDADQDGKTEVLLSRQQIVTALLDVDAANIQWWRFRGGGGKGGMDGLADVDGDGRREVGSIAYGKKRRLICLDIASGELEWELPLPDQPCSDFASGDVNGDGLAEFVFVCGQTLWAVNGEHGQANVVWQLPLPAPSGAPILADVDGDDHSEILVVTEDGYLRCVDRAD